MKKHILKFSIVAVALGVLSPSPGINIEKINSGSSLLLAITNGSIFSQAEATPRGAGRRAGRRTAQRTSHRSGYHHGGHHHHHHHHPHPGAVVGAAVVTGAVVGAAMATPSCTVVYMNGLRYKDCGAGLIRYY